MRKVIRNLILEVAQISYGQTAQFAGTQVIPGDLDLFTLQHAIDVGRGLIHCQMSACRTLNIPPFKGGQPKCEKGRFAQLAFDAAATLLTLLEMVRDGQKFPSREPLLAVSFTLVLSKMSRHLPLLTPVPEPQHPDVLLPSIHDSGVVGLSC